MSEIKTLQIDRLYTSPESGPYSGIEFAERTSVAMSMDGRPKKEIKVIAPKDWAQNSVDILAQKYLRKAGIPVYLTKVPEYGMPEWLYRSTRNENEPEDYKGEDDARAVFDRLAGCWTYWGWKFNYFSSEEDAKAFYDELRFMMAHQKAAPNSPQWFNAGMHWAYGIEGSPQGHYYFDETTNTVVKSTSTYERPQVHACFILSIEDNLVERGGIIDFLVREARIFKFGSGSGANFSKLRGDGEPLSSGGESSGLKSFLQVADASAKAIKSGGKSRRAAKMVVVDIDHPDILQIINWKVREEDKVISLITGSKIVQDFLKKVRFACSSSEYTGSDANNIYKNHHLARVFAEGLDDHLPVGFLSRIAQMLEQGLTDFIWQEFDSNYNGEAYLTVSAQNANNSVRVTNDFMHKVIKDEPFDLIRRTDGGIAATVSARDLWNEIALSAWICADPGVMFHTTTNEWNTCPDEEIRASNPCVEYQFRDNTACNLASLNLCSFLKNGVFDTDSFLHAARLWTIVLEISVGMGQYPSERIAELSYKFRTLGLGYANLGALLMRLGLAYDSPQGRAWAGYITGLLHFKAYETSADMAACFGPFEGYFNNSEGMMRVIRNHRNVVFNEPCVGVEIQPVPLDRDHLSSEQLRILEELAETAVCKGAQYGFRNAQVTAIAPTGTIGILMDCATTGPEPMYNLVYDKKLASGGYMKIVSNAINDALEKLGYENDQISDINKYIIGNGNIDNAPCINRRTLREKGFTDADIDTINKAIPRSGNLESAFSTWVLGDDIFSKLNITQILSEGKTSDSMLECLGFTASEIREASLYALGHKAIEGAPHIRDEDLPVFDCANRNGEYGERFISTNGHIAMLAAIQPFVSGAISKTVNLPSEVAVEDCANVYMNAWKMCLKAVSLFRDGSKLASALYSSRSNQLLNYLGSVSKSKTNDNISELGRGVREALPHRRLGQIQKIKIGDTKYTFFYIIGRNEKGEIREIFLMGGGKEGSAFRSLLSCFAQAISMLLQYGAPLEDIIQHFEHSSFRPSGIVYDHETIKNTDSIVDCLMKGLRYEMERNGYNKEHQSQIGSNNNNNNNSNNTNSNSNVYNISHNSNNNSKNKNKYYTGESCPECGEFKMRKIGGCATCEQCGSNNGCG